MLDHKTLWKLLDIGYITVLYFSFGYIASLTIDKIVGPFDIEKAKKKKTWLLFLEVLFHIYMLGLLIYLIKKIVVSIPSPFDGLNGFKHQQFPEAQTNFVLTFILLYYQKSLKAKLDYISTRVTGF
jgi:hypothetical protein